jgi:nicotinate dehydrogenase subunit B
MVGGWEAPALTDLSRAPVPWTEQALFDYLSTGHAAEHGAAAGPMGEVVAQLAALPASDIAAMAHYVASLSPPRPEVAADSLVNAAWESLNAATGSASASPRATGAEPPPHHRLPRSLPVNRHITSC